jgi:hypothetical protein
MPQYTPSTTIKNFFKKRRTYLPQKKKKFLYRHHSPIQLFILAFIQQVITEHKMHVSDAVGTGNMASNTTSLYTPKSTISATW